MVFIASAFAPTPARYYLWAFALVQEASFLLLSESRGRAEPRTLGDRRSRAESFKALLQPPSDPSRAVDAAHLAERFGLMMIILLGEIVVAVGASAVDVPERGWTYWIGLLGGLVLAGALWWIYLDAAAPISEYVLKASGGNPAMAYGLYAGGHLSPAFALLAVAAGVSLALHGEGAEAAPSLVTGGVAAYLAGSGALVTSAQVRYGRLVRLLVLAATVALALLESLISAAGVVLVVAVWAAAIGPFVTWRLPQRMAPVTSDPLSYLRSG